MKPTPKKRATAAEKRHMDRLAQMGCAVCGAPAEIHHVTSDRHKRITRSNARTVPLCPWHHRLGPEAVEGSQGMGHDRFAIVHRIDLLEWADAAWADSVEIEGGRHGIG